MRVPMLHSGFSTFPLPSLAPVFLWFSMGARMLPLLLICTFAVGMDNLQAHELIGSGSATNAGSTPFQPTRATTGRSLFLRNCAHCHGDDARGNEGPSLYDISLTDNRLKEKIRNGIRGEMPRFGSKLSESDLGALVVFLRTLKN